MLVSTAYHFPIGRYFISPIPFSILIVPNFSSVSLLNISNVCPDILSPALSPVYWLSSAAVLFITSLFSYTVVGVQSLSSTVTSIYSPLTTTQFLKVELTSNPSTTFAATVRSFVDLKFDLTLSNTKAKLVIYSSFASLTPVKSTVFSFVVLKFVAIVFVLFLFVLQLITLYRLVFYLC